MQHNRADRDKAMTASDQRQSGAVLIILVLILIALGSLGVTAISVSTGAMQTRITSGDAVRAYYLAESGVEYAKAVRQLTPNALPNGIFVVSSGDQFQIASTLVSNGVRVVSIGIVNPGALLETRRRITLIVFTVGEDDIVPVGFDFDNDGEFDDDTWDLIGLKKADIVDTGPSGGESALDLMGTEGSIELSWQDKPELDLARAWNRNGQLLNYELQMKISPFETGNEQAYSHHFMLGFSFRLYPDTSTSYGVSFFRSRLYKSNGNPATAPAWIPAALEPLRGTNLYLVLWYREDNLFELLNYKMLDVESGIVWMNNGVSELRDYSTLLLKLDEQYDVSGRRENAISTYLQNTDVYPNWSDASDTRWSDDSEIFSAPVQWEHPVTQFHVDDRLTSEEFSVDRPSEVAVHIFYDLPGANKKFFDDFAMQLEGFQISGPGVDQIQY